MAKELSKAELRTKTQELKAADKKLADLNKEYTKATAEAQKIHDKYVKDFEKTMAQAEKAHSKDVAAATKERNKIAKAINADQIPF